MSERSVKGLFVFSWKSVAVALGLSAAVLLGLHFTFRIATPKRAEPVVVTPPSVPTTKTNLSPEAVRLTKSLEMRNAEYRKTNDEIAHLRTTLSQKNVSVQQAAQLKVKIAQQQKLADGHLAAIGTLQKELMLKAPPAQSAASTSFQMIYAASLLGFVMLVALVVSAITLYIYLASPDPVRAERAGRIFKTAFTFIITTASGAAAYLGFVPKNLG